LTTNQAQPNYWTLRHLAGLIPFVPQQGIEIGISPDFRFPGVSYKMSFSSHPQLLEYADRGMPDNRLRCKLDRDHFLQIQECAVATCAALCAVCALPFARLLSERLNGATECFFPQRCGGRNPLGGGACTWCWSYFDSLVMASAALPARTQFAEPATTASSSNQRNPKSSMHSGKSGLMTMYPGMTAPGI
jgi:hypothetical protein